MELRRPAADSPVATAVAYPCLEVEFVRGSDEEKEVVAVCFQWSARVEGRAVWAAAEEEAAKRGDEDAWRAAGCAKGDELWKAEVWVVPNGFVVGATSEDPVRPIRCEGRRGVQEERQGGEEDS